MNIYRYTAPADEKPLEHMVSDGGDTSIFRSVACVGDSLSSGEFETVDGTGSKHYYDMFEYSWGQFLARMAGLTVYNFSRGGMTAAEYCEGYAASRGWWDADKAAQAYVIALGVNDIMNAGRPLGEMGDICLDDPTQNAKTFTGYYARIIQQYKAIQPDARFFLVTMPVEEFPHSPGTPADGDAHARRLHELAAFFDNTYVIDLRAYGPKYDDEFKETFFLHGHMNPMGYRLTAEMIGSYIDYIIRHNPKDFAHVGFIGNQIAMLC